MLPVFRFTVPRHLTRLVLGLAALVALLLPLAPAHAASSPTDTPPAVAALRQELDSLQNKAGVYTVQQARRLADLSRLETAIGSATDRPTVDNGTTHNLGVFVRDKRQDPEQPAPFTVLGAGHETDDDAETIALFIPADVPLSWPGHPAESGTTSARVARLLPGQELSVSEGEDGQGYRLNLPAFRLETPGTERTDLAALPSLSQSELDAQPETAPVD
jgi:hypothetical protein